MLYSQLKGINIPVSRISLGTGSLYSNKTWGYQDKNNSYNTILSALKMGINFFDTAEDYCSGWLEDFLGKVLKQNIKRHQVVIATKVSPRNLTESRIEKACDNSLKRLQTDYIDLYQIHWPNSLVPIEETLGAMQKLQEKGKILSYGISNFGLTLLQQIPNSYTPVTNQLPYNLLWRGIEHEIKGICSRKNIGLITYSPLAQGLLTGKFFNAEEVPVGRARTRLFSCDRERTKHLESGLEDLTFQTIDELRNVSSESGIALSLLSLAWLLSHNEISSVIVGARNSSQIISNATACKINLNSELIKKIEHVTNTLKNKLDKNVDPWQTESRIV